MCCGGLGNMSLASTWCAAQLRQSPKAAFTLGILAVLALRSCRVMHFLAQVLFGAHELRSNSLLCAQNGLCVQNGARTQV